MSVEPYVGQISMAGFNFAPRGWALCNGQIMSIAQNSALFSLLGTQFGGNGQTTFGLPDLRGRVPVHQGQGTGLTNRTMGELSGSETVTLITSEMPQHNHLINVTSGDSTVKNPANNVLGGTATPTYAVAPNGNFMNGQTLTLTGGNQPHQNMQPYQVISFIIALEGIFPSRN
ncbi:MAG TPA: tail fiber protein [Iamia sp.]|nr:tail fiber protein [Iamia sp.]